MTFDEIKRALPEEHRSSLEAAVDEEAAANAGVVYTMDGVEVARISYNGQIWIHGEPVK